MPRAGGAQAKIGQNVWLESKSITHICLEGIHTPITHRPYQYHTDPHMFDVACPGTPMVLRQRMPVVAVLHLHGQFHREKGSMQDMSPAVWKVFVIGSGSESVILGAWTLEVPQQTNPCYVEGFEETKRWVLEASTTLQARGLKDPQKGH